MSSKTNPPIPAAIAADGTVPLTPEQLVEQLRVLRQHIPDFGPLDVPDAAALRRTAHVNDDLVQAATNTVGASTFVSGAVGRDADGMRTERIEIGRWSAVEDEMRTMYKGVAAANLTRRYRLGLSSLQTYLITRQLVRQREHAHLLPHLEEMRRVNKFGKRRTQTAATPDAPTPAPTPAPAPAKS
jgi:hypothetical protein